jgi:hypothetical protein
MPGKLPGHSKKYNFKRKAMLLYNETVNVEEAIHEEWLGWMKEVHIPDIMGTGLFTGFKVLNLLNEHPNGGVTYCIQYYMKTMEDYDAYSAKHAPRLEAIHADRYEGKFVTFRTLLLEV